MSTTIPYSPSLVLGSIIDPAAIATLLAVSAAQTPIDAAQETLNSFISMKRSLEMTVQELINMKIDPKDLVKKVQEVGNDVDKAATAYATTRLEQELKLQPLRAKMQMVNASVESPIDYNRTKIKTLPLAADSLKMDAQFFTFDDNQENDSNILGNIKSYVGAATSFLGIDTSFDMAKTAVDQVDKQRQLHKISGTLVLTASCTHKEAQVLAPLFLDVDKAIRVWNELFPGEKIRTDEDGMRQIVEHEGSPQEKAFNIISGATLGSSFVGMVHVLNVDSTSSSQDDDSTERDAKSTLALGAAVASIKGGFGVNKSFASDVKKLLSTQNINSHVTLITAGFIPTIKANDVAIGVKQFASFDPSDMMTSLAKLSDFTSADRNSAQQAATAARTKGEFVALKTANIESVMQSLSKLDDQKNGMLDISSMVVAFEDYVNTATAVTLETPIGVPINYYLKPITRTQLAQMWVSKYYPNKYVDIQGDDAPRPKKEAPAS